MVYFSTLPRQPFYRKIMFNYGFQPQRLVFINHKKNIAWFDIIANLHLTPCLDFQEMTSILILVNFWLVFRVFDQIHIVDGFYLQFKIF